MYTFHGFYHISPVYASENMKNFLLSCMAVSSLNFSLPLRCHPALSPYHPPSLSCPHFPLFLFYIYNLYGEEREKYGGLPKNEIQCCILKQEEVLQIFAGVSLLFQELHSPCAGRMWSDYILTCRMHKVADIGVTI